MLATVIYFLPCIVSLIWLTMFLLRKKNNIQKLLTWLLGVACLHYASTAIFISPATDFYWVSLWDVICQPLIICTITLCVIYIRAHITGHMMRISQIEMFFVPAIIQAAVIWLLYYMIGFDNVVRFTQAVAKASDEMQGTGDLFKNLPPEFNTQLYRLFHLFDETVSNIWCGTLAIILVWSCGQVSRKYGYKFGDAFRYWFLGGESTAERGVSFWMLLIVVSEIPFLVLGRKYIYNHPAIGLSMAVLASVSLFFMAFCEYYNPGKRFTFYSLIHADMHIRHDDFVNMHEQETAKNEVVETKEEDDKEEVAGKRESAKDAVVETQEETAQEEVVETGQESAREAVAQPVQEEKKEPVISRRQEAMNNSLATELRHLLEENKIFMDKDLTLENLAKRMGTNRNKLSTIVSQTYGEDFRNVLAGLRIEEAKRFMKANPFETSETVAMHCGFKDTSAFFHRFKDIVGESPRMWIANRKNG